MPGETHYREMPIIRQCSKLKDLLISKGNVITIYYHLKVWFTIVREVGKESHVFDNLEMNWAILCTCLSSWLMYHNNICVIVNESGMPDYASRIKFTRKIGEDHSWIALSKLLLITWLTQNVCISYSLIFEIRKC